ncbi:hypothetical protein ABPG72_018350 [Tetrahymena utriculariae]
MKKDKIILEYYYQIAMMNLKDQEDELLQEKSSICLQKYEQISKDQNNLALALVTQHENEVKLLENVEQKQEFLGKDLVIKYCEVNFKILKIRILIFQKNHLDELQQDGVLIIKYSYENCPKAFLIQKGLNSISAKLMTKSNHDEMKQEANSEYRKSQFEFIQQSIIQLSILIFVLKFTKCHLLQKY